MKDKLSIVGSLNVGIGFREEYTLVKYSGRRKHIGAILLFVCCGLLESIQYAQAKRSLSWLHI